MIQISNLTLPLILLAYGRAAALTISSTDPGSALRLAGFSFLAILAHLQFVLAPNFCTSGMWNGGVVFNCVFSIAYITHLLFLKGIDQSDLIEKPSDSQSVFSLAYNYIYNYRGIRTPWQVKNVPRFPLYYSKGSGPERWRFLLRQAAFVVWYYLVLDLASSLSAQETAEDRDRQYGHGLEYSYLNATAEQWTIRVVSSVATWYIMARVIIDMIYRATSLIFVGTGLSSPVDWPPFFGSVWDAYTLRNFWGKFWHQSLRLTFSSMSSFITQRGLGLPKPSILERYTNILLVFTLSGILHALTDMGAGRSTYLGTMMFFQSFTLGIAIEDAVQELWRRFFETTMPTKASGSGSETAGWKKVAGAIWTMFFICMVAPWYGYPVVVTPLEERWILPYLLTEKLGAPVTGLAVGLGATILKVAFKPEI